MCGLNPLPVWSRWARHQIPPLRSRLLCQHPGVLLRHEQRGGIGGTVPHVQFEASADFRGHSLSVSDVVVLNREGQAGTFYVDRIGFKELPGFLEQMKEAARPQKSVAAQIKQAKEAAPKAKTKKHKERDAR